MMQIKTTTPQGIPVVHGLKTPSQTKMSIQAEEILPSFFCIQGTSATSWKKATKTVNASKSVETCNLNLQQSMISLERMWFFFCKQIL